MPSKTVKNRYEVNIISQSQVEVIDHDTGTAVRPTCGHDALHTYEFLRTNLRYGECVAQSFLAEIAAGGMPVSSMIKRINDDRSHSSSIKMK